MSESAATKVESSAPESPEVTRDLLVIEDDAGLQTQMKWSMAGDFEVHLAGNQTDAMGVMERVHPALVVLDLGLPPDANGATEGLATLSNIVGRYPSTKIVIASGNEDRAHALKAISLGAHDFFSKPVDIDQLRIILERAWRFHTLEEENRRLAHIGRDALQGIIASSPAMLEICQIVQRIACTDVSLLVLGESGTGKEMVARALHGLSDRAHGPFVAVNCAAIPDALLESELFGHERGAFTGAVKQTNGKVEQARGGTLFLDEIGDMPLTLQVKMLRFLQERTIQRVGGRQDIPVDVRIVSASNRPLQAMIGQGPFREDLYFRLNEVAVTLPPLRERNGDTLLIAYALLQRYADLYKKSRLEFSQAALTAINTYPWPGNVRELENRIKRAVVLTTSPRISPADLGLAEPTAEACFVTLRQARKVAEVDAIRKALASCNNNLSRTAKVLGVSRPTLYSLLADYEIRAPH